MHGQQQAAAQTWILVDEGVKKRGHVKEVCLDRA